MNRRDFLKSSGLVFVPRLVFGEKPITQGDLVRIIEKIKSNPDSVSERNGIFHDKTYVKKKKDFTLEYCDGPTRNGGTLNPYNGVIDSHDFFTLRKGKILVLDSELDLVPNFSKNVPGVDYLLFKEKEEFTVNFRKVFYKLKEEGRERNIIDEYEKSLGERIRQEESKIRRWYLDQIREVKKIIL